MTGRGTLSTTFDTASLKGPKRGTVWKQTDLLSTVQVMRTLGRDETMRRAFGEAGACEVIVPQMRGYSTDAVVACEGCWAIRNLAIDDNLASILAAYEACQAVVDAMRGHPTHRSTQEQVRWPLAGLGLLSWLDWALWR
jgi:hypothetical protein